MFHNDTVFVLGAGASWHYGYPTGEGLVDCVISMASRFAEHCKNRVASGQVVQLVPKYVQQRIDASKGALGANEGWLKVQSECMTLAERLKTVRPLVIDYFLAWNKSLQPIGTLMVAAAILECEAIWWRERADQNRRLVLQNGPKRLHREEMARYDISKYKDEWCRFIVHKLVYGCTSSSDLFVKNKVRFVTFNYDASLEFQLSRSLAAIDLFDPSDIDAFFRNDRIVHVYGSVHSGIPTEGDFIDWTVAATLGQRLSKPPNFETEFAPRTAFLDRCLVASETLLTIDPHTKEQDEVRLALAKAISKCQVLYILGYGFDENNNKRIGLDGSLRRAASGTRSVMFTNYLDINLINKRASKLFFGQAGQIAIADVYPRSPVTAGYVERSRRDVYEALELDFDALESELLAGTSI